MKKAGKLGVLKPLQMSFAKEDAVKTGRFVLYFILFYLLLAVAVEAVLPMKTMEAGVAGNVLFFLQATGHSGQIAVEDTAIILLDAGPSIEISELCTGLMETLIIVAAILASMGLSWKRRIAGALVAGILTVVLNHARIVFTTMLILGTGDISLIEFTHNVLFRVFLFVTIALVYIAWFFWAVTNENSGFTKEKI